MIEEVRRILRASRCIYPRWLEVKIIVTSLKGPAEIKNVHCAGPLCQEGLQLDSPRLIRPFLAGFIRACHLLEGSPVQRITPRKKGLRNGFRSFVRVLRTGLHSYEHRHFDSALLPVLPISVRLPVVKKIH